VPGKFADALDVRGLWKHSISPAAALRDPRRSPAVEMLVDASFRKRPAGPGRTDGVRKTVLPEILIDVQRDFHARTPGCTHLQHRAAVPAGGSGRGRRWEVR